MLIKTIEKLEACNLDIKNHQALAVITAIGLICNSSKCSKLEWSKTIFDEISSKSKLSVATIKNLIKKLIDAGIITQENNQIYIQEVLEDFQKRQKKNQNKKKYRKSQNVNRDNPKSLKSLVKSISVPMLEKIKNFFGVKSDVNELSEKKDTPKSQLKQSEPSNSSKKTDKKKNYQKNNLVDPIALQKTVTEDTIRSLQDIENHDSEKTKAENDRLKNNLAIHNEMLKRSNEATLAYFSSNGKGNTSNNQIIKKESQYNITNDAVIERKHLMENCNTPKQVQNEMQSDVSILKDDVSKNSSMQKKDIQKSSQGITQYDKKYDINYSDYQIIENDSENDLQSLFDSTKIQDVNTPIQVQNEIQPNVSDLKSQITENKSQQKLDIIQPKSQDSPKKQSNQISSGNNAKNVTLLEQKNEDDMPMSYYIRRAKEIMARKNANMGVGNVVTAQNFNSVEFDTTEKDYILKETIEIKEEKAETEYKITKYVEQETKDTDYQEPTKEVPFYELPEYQNLLTDEQKKYRWNWWRFTPDELLHASNIEIKNRINDTKSPYWQYEKIFMSDSKYLKGTREYEIEYTKKRVALFHKAHGDYEFRKENIRRALIQRNIMLAKHFDVPLEIVNRISPYDHPFSHPYFMSHYKFIEKHLHTLRKATIEAIPEPEGDEKLFPKIITEKNIQTIHSYIYNININIQNNKISETTKLNFQNDEKSFQQKEKKNDKKTENIDVEQKNEDNKKIDKNKLLKEVFTISELESKIQNYKYLKPIYSYNKKYINDLLSFKDMTVHRLEKILTKMNSFVKNKENDGNFWKLLFHFTKADKKNNEGE